MDRLPIRPPVVARANQVANLPALLRERLDPSDPNEPLIGPDLLVADLEQRARSLPENQPLLLIDQPEVLQVNDRPNLLESRDRGGS